jgi:outer membrane protein OmpA-like peptidoglycan-associated protein
VSYGEERPAMGGEGEEAFTKNRRVELVYGSN